MSNETIQTILKRRSIRSYQTNQIKDEELNLILEAGKYAPSAINQQSWHFTVIQNKDLIDAYVEDLKAYFMQSDNERVRQNAQRENFNPYYGAPTVIIVSGNEKAVNPNADCAAATQNMMLAATSLNIGSCWINNALHLFNSDKGEAWIEKLNIPEGYKPTTSIALGYIKNDTEVKPRKENSVNIIK